MHYETYLLQASLHVILLKLFHLNRRCWLASNLAEKPFRQDIGGHVPVDKADSQRSPDEAVVSGSYC